MIERLLEMCLQLPRVQSRQSRFAAPQCRALCLSGPTPSGRPGAFIDGSEFCHLHAPPEGSIHLVLPPNDVESVVAQGWAARHPIHGLGVHEGLVMVYAPRNLDELETVFSLVERSWRFAGGAPDPLAA